MPQELTAPIKILVVDDHAMIRMGLRMRLNIEPDFSVIGEAENGQVALQRAEQLHPDVILMDVVMPEMNGIAATYLMNKYSPGSSVILMSLFDNENMRQQARAAGAQALVPKSSASEPMLSAIRLAVHQVSV
jgi:DNA-binding NarL/FixJ family response regulator